MWTVARFSLAPPFDLDFQPLMQRMKTLQLPHYSAPSQLILRRISAFGWQRLWVVNYPADDFLVRLQAEQPGGERRAFGHDYAAFSHVRGRLLAAGYPVDDLLFGPVQPLVDRPYDAALVFLPKSRPLLEMTLAMTVAQLAAGAAVYLVGENKAGIRSSRAQLEQWVGPAKQLETGRHCVLFLAHLQQAPAPFDLEQWLNYFQIKVRDLELRVASLPGVFSHGRLDHGTRLLLESLDPPPGESILDFACGVGVIGAALLKRWPHLQVDLADVSALSLEATRRTMAANGLAPSQVIASDIFSNINGVYDQIVSNPPFHTGVETNYRLVTAFIEGAHRHLRPGGSLRIVVQRFLKIQPLIEAQVGPCRVVAQNRQYAVYEGVKPKT
jgi:16S rRNA (guanine1207-N2)-methyltransferase